MKDAKAFFYHYVARTESYTTSGLMISPLMIKTDENYKKLIKMIEENEKLNGEKIIHIENLSLIGWE